MLFALWFSAMKGSAKGDGVLGGEADKCTYGAFAECADAMRWLVGLNRPQYDLLQAYVVLYFHGTFAS